MQIQNSTEVEVVKRLYDLGEHLELGLRRAHPTGYCRKGSTDRMGTSPKILLPSRVDYFDRRMAVLRQNFGMQFSNWWATDCLLEQTPRGQQTHSTN